MELLLGEDHDDAQIAQCVQHKHMTFAKFDPHTWYIDKAAEVDHEENETPQHEYEVMCHHLRRISHY
jgi:hypothetical protein